MPLRNAPSSVPTTLRYMASRIVHKAEPASKPSTADYRTRIDGVVCRLGTAVLRCDYVTLPFAQDWIDTGIDVAAGQEYTLLAGGMVHLSRAFDVGFAPKVGLFVRVPGGEVAKILGQASSFKAAAAGNVQMTTKPPGEFAARDGRFDPEQKRQRLSGAFEIAVIQWRDSAAAGLTAAAALDPGLFGSALKRLKDPVRPPQGWHYLWRLGEGEIFHDSKEGALCCTTSSDVGILQYPIELPLDDSTKLSWSWCVDQLPSKLPEHIQPTHDYLSIAIEFDNGLDLTYMWSAALPVGTVFQCPLPWWDQRETHWVVRSGAADLGRWLEEERPVLDDYRVAIGGPPPARVVAVWLIANTAFQRGVGECRYRGIGVESQGKRHVVHD